MTYVKRPGFLDSPYFVGEPGNWHLKPGAPESVKREFERFVQNVEVQVTKPEDIELDL